MNSGLQNIKNEDDKWRWWKKVISWLKKNFEPVPDYGHHTEHLKPTPYREQFYYFNRF